MEDNLLEHATNHMLEVLKECEALNTDELLKVMYDTYGNEELIMKVMESLFEKGFINVDEVFNEDSASIKLTSFGKAYLSSVQAEKEPHKPEVVMNTWNITGSNVNINSILKDVVQSIGAANNLDDTVKEQLKKLIEELETELQKAAPERKEEAEAVADAAKAFVEAGTKPQPNKITVNDRAESLKKAAENIAGVMPTVLSIASSIVKTVLPFLGIPLP